MAAASKAAEKNGGISQSFKKQVNLERMAFLAALRGMYWLTKNQVAHTTKFASLLGMMQGLGLSYLTHLNKVTFNYLHRVSRKCYFFIQLFNL